MIVPARAKLDTSPYANGLEAEYAALLEMRKTVVRDIADWRYQPLRLILAQRCTYEPDFLVILPNGLIELHEVKGRWMDDARVKIKVAARQFPWFRFVACQRPSKKIGWMFEEITP